MNDSVPSAPVLDPDAEAITRGDHGDAFAYLGPHRLEDGRCVVRAFLPKARTVRLIAAGGTSELGVLDSIHVEGVFQIILREPPRFPYRLRVEWNDASTEFIDPYQFGPVLGEIDLHLFREGTHFLLYERLGAHPVSLGEV